MDYIPITFWHTLVPFWHSDTLLTLLLKVNASAYQTQRLDSSNVPRIQVFLESRLTSTSHYRVWRILTSKPAASPPLGRSRATRVAAIAAVNLFPGITLRGFGPTWSKTPPSPVLISFGIPNEIQGCILQYTNLESVCFLSTPAAPSQTACKLVQ